MGKTVVTLKINFGVNIFHIKLKIVEKSVWGCIATLNCFPTSSAVAICVVLWRTSRHLMHGERIRANVALVASTPVDVLANMKCATTTSS